jgi:phospholipid/cholesterol/gamma-HCH transport system substrate-binding protein
VPVPPVALDQGSDIDEHPPTSPVPDFLGLNRPGVDYSGSEGEQQVVNALLAAATGRSADSFGSLGSLMFGPLVRVPAGGAS